MQGQCVKLSGGSLARQKKAARDRWEAGTYEIRVSAAKEQFNQGRYDEAEKVVRECVKSEYASAEAYLLLGKIILVKGKYKEAQEQLHKAVELNNELHKGWYWLGLAAQENRDYKKAYRCYEKAMLLEPMDCEYILAAADVLSLLDESAAAEQLLREKMVVMPSNVSLKTAAANLMLRRGNTRQATRLYEQAALLADEEAIFESLGYCYMLDGRWEVFII